MKSLVKSLVHSTSFRRRFVMLVASLKRLVDQILGIVFVLVAFDCRGRGSMSALKEGQFSGVAISRPGRSASRAFLETSK